MFNILEYCKNKPHKKELTFPLNGWYDQTAHYGFRSIRHYVNDKLHSINDEPAIIYNNGSRAWYKEGLRHRETGPAVLDRDGRKEYYFRGLSYYEITSDLEWLMKVEELKKNLT